MPFSRRGILGLFGAGAAAGAVGVKAAVAADADLQALAKLEPTGLDAGFLSRPGVHDGDVWFDGADLKFRAAGVTRTFVAGENLSIGDVVRIRAGRAVRADGCPTCAGSDARGWVCEFHPNHPWNGKCCGGAGAPCTCNPLSKEA